MSWPPGDPRGHWSPLFDLYDRLRVRGGCLNPPDRVTLTVARRRAKEPPKVLNAEEIQVASNTLGVHIAPGLPGVDEIPGKPGAICKPVAFAAAIEPTHVHLLVGPVAEDLARFVGRLKGTSSGAVLDLPGNSNRRRVWTAGYWKVFLATEEAVETVKKYIDAHNVRRGLAAAPFPWLSPYRPSSARREINPRQAEGYIIRAIGTTVPPASRGLYGTAMPTPLPSAIRDLLTLSLVPGIGPRLTAALLERFGSAAAALGASVAELSAIPYLTPRLAESIAQAPARDAATAELERMEKHGVRLIALGTPEYPPALANIPDPPYLLYLRGTLTPADANAVALVGSRGCTDYGRRIAARLSAGLVRAGVTVVSGLARGIDGAAHRAALEAGGRTLAVLANGLSRIYPPEHADLAREIEASGAVLTETSMDQKPLAGLFPVRNRIISGLSKIIVLVEAAQKSGALITASHAGDQGRTVLAVPGLVEAASSGGCHELIRKGAVLCRGVEDILEELHGVSAMAVAEKKAASAPTAPAIPSGPPPGLDDSQRRIWEALTEACHLDQLVQRLGLAVPQVSGALMMMEMKKVVRRLPGNRYERC